MMFERVAVVGCGLIGRSWAIAFARAGYEVALHDPVAGASTVSLGVIRGLVADLAAAGMIDEDAQVIMNRIREAGDLASAVADAIWVQESAPERVDLKRELWSSLDALAPAAAILASSTSAILPSKFTDHLARRGRCLVAHPLNPPYLIPAVELCPAPWTTPETMLAAETRLRGMGQRVIVLRREIEGFVMNRLQAALVEEAMKLVAADICGPEEVDIALRDGLALRWSFMGPFETGDLNAPGGIRDYIARYHGVFDSVAATPLARPDWTGRLLDRVEEARSLRLRRDEIAHRQRWRDRRLMALARHKREARDDIGD